MQRCETVLNHCNKMIWSVLENASIKSIYISNQNQIKSNFLFFWLIEQQNEKAFLTDQDQTYISNKQTNQRTSLHTNVTSHKYCMPL
jgi:hypothetical protein